MSKKIIKMLQTHTPFDNVSVIHEAISIIIGQTARSVSNKMVKEAVAKAYQDWGINAN